MKKSPLKTKHRFINMLIFAGLFIFVPQIFNSFVETFAPTSYFFQLEEIEVSDMQYGKWQQNVIIDRKVRKNLYGSPQIELFIYKDGNIEQAQKILTVAPPDTQVLYETNNSNSVSYIRDWSDTIAVEELEKLSLDETYHWLWVIELQLTKNRSEIVHMTTNGFKILPPAILDTTQIQIDSAENVQITQ